jgi:ABC-type transport system involved in multi-copper enzyme maturation permease subunit
MKWSEVFLIVRMNCLDLSRQWMAMLFLFLSVVGFGAFLIVVSPKDLTARVEPPRPTLAFTHDAEFLRDVFEKKFTVVDLKDKSCEDAIKSGAAEVVIESGPDLRPALEGADKTAVAMPVVRIWYDSGRGGISNISSKAYGVMLKRFEKIRQARLTTAGVPELWELRYENVKGIQSKQKNNDRTMEFARVLVTWTSLVTSMLGGIIAMGLISEEQQKKSMILVLLSPTSKSSFAVAHFLFSAFISVLFFASAYLIVAALITGKLDSPVATTSVLMRPPTATQWQAMLMGIELCFSASALGLIASSYVRSVEHVGIFSGLLVGIFAICNGAIFLPRYDMTPALGLVPFSGSGLAMLDILTGIYDWPLILVSTVSTVVVCAVAIWHAARRFSDSRMLENAVQSVR